MGKIGANNLRTVVPCLLAQGESHIPRTAAQIQDSGVGLGKDLGEGARRAAPPQAIDIKRQHVIEQVIARSDRGKHLADRTRRRTSVTGALRSGTDYG